MKIRNIKVRYFATRQTVAEETFIDWFDFADWLKQMTLDCTVTIIEWRYEEKQL